MWNICNCVLHSLLRHSDSSISSWLVCLNTISMCKVLFTILQHCCTHWPRWPHTWCGPCNPSSLTKMLVSQSVLCTFTSAFTLVTLALCVTECWRTLKGTLKSFSFKNYIKLWCSLSNIPLGCFTIIEIWGENVLENTKKIKGNVSPVFVISFDVRDIFWNMTHHVKVLHVFIMQKSYKEVCLDVLCDICML